MKMTGKLAAEKRRLGGAAVGHALRGSKTNKPGDDATMLAQALELIRELEGQDEAICISDAKEKLRGLGGSGTASPLGSLSKARNWTSHPERFYSLMAAIRRLDDEAASGDALTTERFDIGTDFGEEEQIGGPPGWQPAAEPP